MVQDPDRLLGQEIGPYRLEALIAETPRSRVYKAVHAVMGSVCAFKTCRPRVAIDDTALARFRREIRITAALQHPNIIRFYDAGRYAEKDLIYLVTEFFAGTDLERRHAGRPAGFEELLLVSLQAAGALAAAHAQGVVHREIAPGNLLVDGAGLLKIVNFGIAKAYEESTERLLTDPLELLGNPCYMPPEQTFAPDRITARADVYGLAAVMRYCLLGEPPYEGSAMEVVQKIGSPLPPLRDRRPEIPAPLAVLVERGMAVDPDARWPDMNAFRLEIESLLSLLAPGRAPDVTPAVLTPASTPSPLPLDLLIARQLAAARGSPPPPTPYLRIFGIQEGCWELRLPADRAVQIGRTETADIRLPDASVSRAHAIIAPAGDGHTVLDKGSRAGTLLNGAPVEAAVRLSPGDTLQIAHYILQYRKDGRSIGEVSRQFPLNFLPSTMEARYRVVHCSPSQAFAPGDTLPIARGGVLLPVPMAPPEESILEIELTWPNGKKKAFLAETLGTLPLDDQLLLCVKLHQIEREEHERILKHSQRGVWATAEKS